MPTTQLAVQQTAPPGRYVVLYDGLCPFCTSGAKKLSRLAKPGVLDLVSFQAPGALDQFPGVSFDACMRRMHLVTPEGRVYGGVEAVVRALATRPLLGWIVHVYSLPGLKPVLDRVYEFIAANRYRIMGKGAAQQECNHGTCVLHGSRR
jgi:predicted DCC family thiol-disulfide oxidoreductase YuxK